MIMQVPFKESPTKDTCVECGELVMIPPGVYHNGDSEQPMHKVCDSLRNKIDFNEEVLSPMMDDIEEGLTSIMSHMKEDP